MLDKATIENLLTALGKQIESMQEGPINIAVCGGASLNVLGQVRRTTIGLMWGLHLLFVLVYLKILKSV